MAPDNDQETHTRITRDEIESIAASSAKAAVHETLSSLGIDVSNPAEAQRTFAMIFTARRLTDRIALGAILLTALTIVSGILTAFWLGFRILLKQGS